MKSEKSSILLVESDMLISDRLVKMLEKDHHVKHLTKVEEAGLALISQRFDACLLGSAGESERVLRDLQEMLCAATQSPILLLLPKEEPDLVEKSRLMGAVEVMVKQVSPERLRRAIRYAVARHSAYRTESIYHRDSLTQLPNF